MATPIEIEDHARRWKRRFFVALAVIVVLAMAAVAWAFGLFTPGEREEAAPAPEPTQAAPTGDGFVPVEGQAQVGRHQVEFPQSPHGAVSAMLAYLSGISTNDAAAWAQAETVYGPVEVSPEHVEDVLLPERAQYVAGYAPDTASVDTGSFPLDNSYFYLRPMAVAWEEVAQDRVQVAVLVTEEISDGAGTVFTQRMIHTGHMVWDPQVRGGDWVRTGDQAADDEGWYSYTQEDLDPNNGVWILIEDTE